jgi:hypothetical protein
MYMEETHLYASSCKDIASKLLMRYNNDCIWGEESVFINDQTYFLAWRPPFCSSPRQTYQYTSINNILHIWRTTLPSESRGCIFPCWQKSLPSLRLIHLYRKVAETQTIKNMVEICYKDCPGLEVDEVVLEQFCLCIFAFPLPIIIPSLLILNYYRTLRRAAHYHIFSV